MGVCGCGCAWRYVKEEKGEVRGEGWRQVEGWRGSHVRRQHIQSSAGERTYDDAVDHEVRVVGRDGGGGGLLGGHLDFPCGVWVLLPFLGGGVENA